MGGRAALRTAGHHAVTSVLAVAPWLPEESTDAEPEPVRQLAGRQVMIVHGTNDERCDPELSFRLAERAKKSNRDICRFEVHSDGHALAQHRTEVLSSPPTSSSAPSSAPTSPARSPTPSRPRRHWASGCRWPRGSGGRCGTEARAGGASPDAVRPLS